MKFAIIAAGEGSRLAEEGVAQPKPLVEIGGEPLVDRLIRIFMDNGAEEIVAICNGHMPSVNRHLSCIMEHGLGGRRVPLRYVVKDTPSSMHSMYEISEYLKGEPFCLTTVDTIFREEEFAEYVRAFSLSMKSGKEDGLMAVTDYIDDEKPLYISMDENRNITGFHDSQNGCTHVSGGIYGLSPRSLDILHGCVDKGESRMRNFQRALVRDGLKLKAFAFSKILDIDHSGDIAKAEAFLQGSMQCRTAVPDTKTNR